LLACELWPEFRLVLFSLIPQTAKTLVVFAHELSGKRRAGSSAARSVRRVLHNTSRSENDPGFSLASADVVLDALEVLACVGGVKTQRSLALSHLCPRRGTYPRPLDHAGALLVFPKGKIGEKDNFAIPSLKRLYACTYLSPVAVALFALFPFIFGTFDAEFIPQLDEGSFATYMIRTTSICSISARESASRSREHSRRASRQAKRNPALRNEHDYRQRPGRRSGMGVEIR
jgi:hypothetical protein